MSNTNQPLPEDPQRITELVQSIRNATVHFLRPGQTNPGPTGADRSLGLQILKSSVDTAWKIAAGNFVVAEAKKIQLENEGLVLEKQRLCEERETIKAAMEKLQAEKGGAVAVEVEKEWRCMENERFRVETDRARVEIHKMNAETEKINAEAKRMNAETGRFVVETEKIKAQK